MEMNTYVNEKSDMKWVEGLLLLIIMIFLFLTVALCSRTGRTTILDETVSMSSSITQSIDNLD